MTTTKATRIMIVLYFVLSVAAAAVVAQQYTATALEMTGQQYFANGTGIAYFDDGTTSSFEHSITPDNGYYLNNSTNFYIENYRVSQVEMV